MSERERHHQAFILHSQAYRETSLLLDVLSRDQGRISLVARGARRPRSALRGVLISFQPLTMSWFGKGEVRTLSRAEWTGGQPLLTGESLLCGFYLNELLQRLIPREDAHEALYDEYALALASLAVPGGHAPVLRRFEKALLRELGYAMSLERDGVSGGGIDPAGTYTYDPERGPVRIGPDATAQLRLAGSTLLDMARDDYSDPRTLAQAKALMRTLIGHRLDNRGLESRRIFRELQDL